MSDLDAPERPAARGRAGVLALGLASGLLILALASRPQAAGRPGGARPPVDRLPVPAGPFVQGSARGDDDERPVRTTVLPAFVIDRTEVTRAAFAACVTAHRCKPLPDEAPTTGAVAKLPVTNVSWSDARDFCAYAGGRLPSEAEWEKAARGTDGREFPWGSEVACDRANWGNLDGEGACVGSAPGAPVAVGSYPAGASPYGALDMAGNVWEWVADKYEDEPTRRVVRGGSCCSALAAPRAANRNAWDPEYRGADLGFRCAAAR